MNDRRCLSKEEIIRYLGNDLDPEQAVSISKHLEGCEFCREALEGMHSFHAGHPQHEIEKVVMGLEMELSARTSERHPHPSKPNWIHGNTLILVTFSVIIVIVILLFIFLRGRNPEPAPPPQKPVPSKPVPPSVDTSKNISGKLAPVKTRLPAKRKKEVSTKPASTVTNEGYSQLPAVTPSSNKEAVKENIVTEKAVEQEAPKEIFTVVEQQPEFPGGDAAKMKFLSENIRYPAEAAEKGIHGKVFVTFVVGEDGSITDIRVLRGLGGGCDEEAIRVIKAMPKWIPGRQRGKPVRIQFNLPVAFTLP
jgi:periplasmic protein TonB